MASDGSVSGPGGRSVERTGTVKVSEEKTLSRTAVATVRYVESLHREGACLFCGSPKGDGRKKQGSYRKADFKIVVLLCLIMSMGPTTNEAGSPSKGA